MRQLSIRLHPIQLLLNDWNAQFRLSKSKLQLLILNYGTQSTLGFSYPVHTSIGSRRA